MAEYIDRAKVLALAWEGKIISTDYDKRVRDFINEIPSADVRPVVKCRDCGWGLAGRDYVVCMKHRVPWSHDPDWFCADGERDCGANMREG